MERVIEVVEKKVAVMACNGLDQILGTVARMAAYKVLDELRTESTVLLCPPALIAEVEEDVEFVRENPVLVIEGCKHECGCKIVGKFDGEIGGIVRVDMHSEKSGLNPESMRELGSEGERLVKLISETAANEVDRIVGGAP